MKPLVIYHGNCADGFTAAWLANIFFAQIAECEQEEQPRSPYSGPFMRPTEWYVEAHAGVYGKEPPDVTDRLVYILDFSYTPEVMLAIADRAKLVVWIDHHDSAIKAMQDVQHTSLRKQVSNERSGAYLTAEYFWPGREPMDMVKLVDDRDRWVFADKRSRPFAAGLFSRPYKIGEWNYLAQHVDQTVLEGEAIDRNNLKAINELLDVQLRFEDIDGVSVPTANMSYMSSSDGGAEMLRRHPEVPFAATWYLRKDGKKVYSLRSRNGEDVDVGAIAKKFGGGGHKHAAGFAV